MRIVSLLLFSCVWMFGCISDDDSCDLQPILIVDKTQRSLDVTAIDKYLSDNNLFAHTDETGLRYAITDEGSGSAPSLCNEVTFTYTGRLMSNGEVFDESDTPVTIPLANLITGFQIGIPKVNSGGRITLYIPSVYGYGAQGVPDLVPPNANLIFDVHVIEID